MPSGVVEVGYERTLNIVVQRAILPDNRRKLSSVSTMLAAFFTDGRAGSAHRYANVGKLQGRRVIHAILLIAHTLAPTTTLARNRQDRGRFKLFALA